MCDLPTQATTDMQKEMTAGLYLPWLRICPMRPDQPKPGLSVTAALANAIRVEEEQFVAPNQTIITQSKPSSAGRQQAHSDGRQGGNGHD